MDLAPVLARIATAFESIADDYRKLRIMEETRMCSASIPLGYGKQVLTAAYAAGRGVFWEDAIKALTAYSGPSTTSDSHGLEITK
jgi:hypothetical protein